jgi:hypothetical protein
MFTGESQQPVKVEGQPLSEDAKAWEKNDKNARTVIDELQRPVRAAKSAKEAWDELEKVHAPSDRQR